MKNIIILLLLIGTLSACDKSTSDASADILINDMELINPSTLKVKMSGSVSGGSYNSSYSTWGVCYGLATDPTIDNQIVISNGGNSNFELEIQDLLPNTKYFGRGFYLPDSQGTDADYSLNFSFTTPRVGVGEFKEGGVVFWVDPTDPNHGLVYSLESINLKWGSQGVGIDGTITNVGSGEQNTLLISENDPYYGAAAYCDGLNTGGYDDWFLPSIDELKIIYGYRNIIRESVLQNTGTYQSSNYYFLSFHQPQP